MENSNADNQIQYFDSANQGSAAVEELKGILKYRDLVFQLIHRDIVTRYKRSFLGVA